MMILLRRLSHVNPESRENVEVTRTSIEIKNQNSNLVTKKLIYFHIPNYHSKLVRHGNCQWHKEVGKEDYNMKIVIYV